MTVEPVYIYIYGRSTVIRMEWEKLKSAISELSFKVYPTKTILNYILENSASRLRLLIG